MRTFLLAALLLSLSLTACSRAAENIPGAGAAHATPPASVNPPSTATAVPDQQSIPAQTEYIGRHSQWPPVPGRICIKPLHHGLFLRRSEACSSSVLTAPE